jgi:plastocyanin
MTWRWLTCSSFVLFSSCVITARPAAAASVSGSVRLENSRVASVRNNGDYSGVVVWLTPAAPAASAAEGAERKTGRILQRKKTFLPHITAVPVGTAIEFPNGDPIFHNVFSNFDGQRFDLGLYPPGTSRTVPFWRPGIVRLFCNIHPTMSAVIAVVDSPYFAISDRKGEFQIAGAPAGEYTLQFFHERASGEEMQNLRRKVALDGTNDLRLPAIPISETGFVQRPHKNKHGRNYAPLVDDGIVYSGIRK